MHSEDMAMVPSEVCSEEGIPQGCVEQPSKRGEKVSLLDLQNEAITLVSEANEMLKTRERDPEKINHIKNALMSLISRLTAGLAENPDQNIVISPTLLDEITRVLPRLTDTSLEALDTVDEDRENPASEWVEQDARLSKSVLWKLQEDYYKNNGIEAWNAIPFFVTSSTFIADSYAEMIITYLKDAVDTLDLNEPVYVVEMATGSGRFSQYLIRELINKKKYFSQLKDVKLRYIMTDFTVNNIDFWESHERFKPFIESGELDFAIYRPEEYQFLQLRHSKVKISSKTVKNPMIAIANYFFDTIRQDAFQIDEGVLKESRINLWRNFSDEVKPTDPVKVGQLGYNYTHHVIDDHYYEDEAYNDILRYYRDNFFKASIIFPLGALDCVRNLLQMSNNNLVLISSDKGFTDMEYMLGHRNAEFALHDGAFSYMVNYNAIRRYFDQLGGVSFYSSDKNLDLNTQVNVLMAKAPEKKFDELRYYFSEKIERYNPINYLYTLQGVIFEEFRDIPQDTSFRLSAFLAYFRLNLCDPSTFCRFAPQLFALLEDISFVQRVELLKIMNKTWENYYQFGGESNLPFWIAQVLYGLGLYEKSLAFFEKTNQSGTDTKHEVCFYFMGKCNENLANLREAQRYYLACLEKCPDFAPAREALIDVEIVLRERTTLHDILKI